MRGEGRGLFTFILRCRASPQPCNTNNFISSFSLLYLFFFCRLRLIPPQFTRKHKAQLHISPLERCSGVAEPYLAADQIPDIDWSSCALFPENYRRVLQPRTELLSLIPPRGGGGSPGVDRLSMPWFSTQQAFLMDSLGDESHLCMLTRLAEQRQAWLEMM